MGGGKKLNDSEAVEKLEMPRQELARRLMKLFLPQWLEPGMFHADPHPGNVQFTREGKIILLDFGMAGEISKRCSLF
nr:AarF/UbiB family protein [Cytobacillus firmus]